MKTKLNIPLYILLFLFIFSLSNISLVIGEDNPTPICDGDSCSFPPTRTDTTLQQETGVRTQTINPTPSDPSNTPTTSSSSTPSTLPPTSSQSTTSTTSTPTPTGSQTPSSQSTPPPSSTSSQTQQSTDNSFPKPEECKNPTDSSQSPTQDSANKFNTNDFLSLLGAKKKESQQQTQTQSNNNEPYTPYQSENFEQDNGKIKKDENYKTENFDFKDEKNEKSKQFNELFSKFTKMSGEDKNKVWQTLKENPELHKNFFEIMGKKLGDVNFNLGQYTKEGDLSDYLDKLNLKWDEGGILSVGGEKENSGMKIDLCSIEKYNNQFSKGNNPKEQSYSFQGVDYKNKPQKIKEITLNYAGSYEGGGGPKTTSQSINFVYENDAKVTLSEMFYNQNKNHKTMFNPNEAKIHISDGKSTKEIKWINQRGHISIQNYDTVSTGIVLEETGKNFGIIELDGKIISPYRNPLKDFETEQKAPENGYKMFQKDNKIYTIDKRGVSEVKVAQISLTEKEDFPKESYSNSYVELKEQQKGRFFFGEHSSTEENDPKRRINNFQFSDNNQKLELFGNVIYEQKKDFSTLILSSYGDSKIVNGNLVISQDKNNKIILRTLNGENEGTPLFNAEIITDKIPELDRFEQVDKITIKKGEKVTTKEGRVTKATPPSDETQKTEQQTGTTQTQGKITIDGESYSPGSVQEYTSSDSIESLKELSGDGRTVLIKVGADWCGPCQSSKPHFESFAKNNPNIYSIDIDSDQHTGLTRSLGVTGLPTFIIMRDGEVIKKQTSGIKNANQLNNLLK
jgi:thiol-disulfide isomerase/thioredoxin